MREDLKSKRSGKCTKKINTSRERFESRRVVIEDRGK